MQNAGINLDNCTYRELQLRSMSLGLGGAGKRGAVIRKIREHLARQGLTGAALFSTFHRQELFDACKSRGVKTSGTNVELVARLVDHERQRDQGGRRSWWKGVRAGLWLTGVLAALSVTANVAANPAAFLGTTAPDNAQDSSAQPLDVWAATFEGASSSLVPGAEASSAPAAYQSGTAAFEAAIPPPRYEDTPTREGSPVDASSSAVIDEAVVYTGYQRTVAAEAVGSQIDDGGAEKAYDEAWLVVETVQNAPIQRLAQDRSCGGDVDGGSGGGGALNPGCVSDIAASLEIERSLSTTRHMDATELAVEDESGAAVPAPATRLQTPSATQETPAIPATTTSDSPATDTKG
ncbi:unnamed protein product, partial [Ectocarpus sp. 8 AP-2014]